LVQVSSCSIGVSIIWTTWEEDRPTFQMARPLCWPVHEAMCWHSVSVRPMASRVIASGAVSWARQIRTSQELMSPLAIACSSSPVRASPDACSADMKPLIAIIFAIGFSLIGETETEDGTGATDIATLLSGMLIILLAALAWPALARFMTFTSTHVGGGTGLAAVAGAGAGFLSAQSVPAMGGSASSLQFGQATEARTMAAVGGRMTMAGNKSGAIGGGAMKAAVAAGPWVVGAATALRAVQRGANSLTQRMEQTAARSGIEGANPYALPGGYPGYHQSVASRPPGPDANGEPRPGHGAPQAAPPPPDHGNPNGPTPPPPIQPPPPGTDQGGNR
jgi:hypothetical protein